MSRSGYSEDCEHIELYRASVQRAIRGKRGQLFLKDLLTALDGLPHKCLIAEELVSDEGEVCAIGSVGRLRRIDLSKTDPKDHRRIADQFDIARVLAAEVEFVNDDDFSYRDETPEDRFARVRAWVIEQIVPKA